LLNTVQLMRVFHHAPPTWAQLALPLLINIVITIVAHQAVRRTSPQTPVSSMLIAFTVSYVYFYVLHLITPIIYRLSRR